MKITKSIRQKINLLESLKEERDRQNNSLRFGVKCRWKGNPLTYFGYLQETLITKRKGRLT
tara:strand:- start:660 stop:842 length:183 start_codon:yes stop_codon:yes gene_type:complete